MSKITKRLQKRKYICSRSSLRGIMKISQNQFVCKIPVIGSISNIYCAFFTLNYVRQRKVQFFKKEQQESNLFKVLIIVIPAKVYFVTGNFSFLQTFSRDICIECKLEFFLLPPPLSSPKSQI